MNSKKLGLYNLAIYAHNEVMALDLDNISATIELKHHKDNRVFDIYVYDIVNDDVTCNGVMFSIDDGITIKQHKESVMSIVEAIRTDDFKTVSDVMDMME